MTNYNNYMSINTMSMATNFGRVGIYNKEFPSIKSPYPLITRHTATKLCTVMTYYKKLQPIKSHKPLTHGHGRSEKN